MGDFYQPNDLRTVDPRPVVEKKADDVAVIGIVQRHLGVDAHEVLVPLGLSEVLA